MLPLAPRLGRKHRELQWNFGDSSKATGAAVSHTYATVGTFNVTLTVTDNDGSRSTATATVTTIAGAPTASVKIAGMITFERVPFRPLDASVDPDGLDYAATFEAPSARSRG